MESLLSIKRNFAVQKFFDSWQRELIEKLTNYEIIKCFLHNRLPFPVKREKQVHAKCPNGALKSSNMYDNSTKQSLLLIGYFSGNAIELYRFGLNPSAGFFVSPFLISIIEVTIYL
ncbi:hypothetical protein T01_3809 [Trichinella spiralis]|uniref:Uncharacterized protein n=1 Tax=Trichinella spiralis TaxID=6334 RepID=A0A0V1BAR6_TRISP|nr:hypothetical protein T01_3809 [Trichinella spiralis]